MSFPAGASGFCVGELESALERARRNQDSMCPPHMAGRDHMTVAALRDCTPSQQQAQLPRRAEAAKILSHLK
jgi:hypothetical protein